MALPLKSGADLYNQQAIRMRLHNLGADPLSDFGAGQIYFNTSTDSDTARRVRLYDGTSFRSLAFYDEIADNEEFNALVGRVGTLETMLNTQDAEGVINTWNEIQTFLDSVQEGTDLMDLLNGKLNTSGGTITGNIKMVDSYLRFYKGSTEVGAYNVRVSDNAPIFYDMTIWQTILHSGNYANQIGDYYLKTSGGTMTGKLNFADTSHSIEYHSSGYLSIRNDIAGNSIGLFDTGDISIFKSGLGWFPLLHSGNIGDYASQILCTEAHADGSQAVLKNAISSWGASDSNYQENYGLSLSISNKPSTTSGSRWRSRLDFGTSGKIFYYSAVNSETMTYRGQLAFTDSNVASATKLETARTIWGNSFDGTGNVDWIPEFPYCIGVNRTANGSLVDTSKMGFVIETYASSIRLKGYNTSAANVGGIYINSSGNVTIGLNDDLARTSAKLAVKGTHRIYRSTSANEYLDITVNDILVTYNAYDSDGYCNHVFQSNGASLLFLSGNNKNVGIGTTEPLCALEVAASHKDINATNIAASANFIVGKHEDDGLFVGHDYTKRGSWLQSAYYGTEANPSNEHTYKLFLNPLGGNVLIGTTVDSGAKLNVGGRIDATGSITTRDRLEVYGSQPYIDFHHGNSTEDYTTRLIEQTKGTLKLVGNLHVTGNIIADGEVSAGGAGAEGSGSGGGASVYQEVFTPSTTTVGITHNLGTEDVIITLYEKDSSSSRWSVCLTDIEIVDTNNIDITFGSTSSVQHKVVIMAASA